MLENQEVKIESISVSDNKLDSELDINQVSIGEQLDIDQVSHGYQSDINPISIRKQTGTELDNKQIATQSDLSQLLDPRTLKNQLSKITGIQKKIMDAVVDVCLTNKKLETGPLLTSGLASYVTTTVGTVKITLKRLIDKGFLKRGEGRTARGGYIYLHIKQEVHDLLLQLRKEKELFIHPVNIMQTRNRMQHLPLDNRLDSNSVYSSSNYINNTNTTRNGKNFEIPEEWASVDYSPLEDIGFSKTQLKQLVEYNSPEVVQESIHFFAYEIKQNPDKYKNPLNVIVGVLRKGNSWSAPKGYESPRDQSLREYTERKKVELEKRNQLLDQLMNSEFSEWEKSLNEQDIEKILPFDLRNPNSATANHGISKIARTSTLKTHFREQVLIPRLKGEGIY